MVDTATNWTLPVTLELARGVGPRVGIDEGDALSLDVTATLPSDGHQGHRRLPARRDHRGHRGKRSMDATVRIDRPCPTGGATTYDLFHLYDGELDRHAVLHATRTAHRGRADARLRDPRRRLRGTFDLSGNIDIPWTRTATDGFGEVTYNDVQLDMGEVVDAIATPFDVVDPYLAPVRDVVDVLRTPIPVISDLSELGRRRRDLAAQPARDALRGHARSPSSSWPTA